MIEFSATDRLKAIAVMAHDVRDQIDKGEYCAPDTPNCTSIIYVATMNDHEINAIGTSAESLQKYINRFDQEFAIPKEL